MGLFSGIFSKSRKTVEVDIDMSLINTDIHSHLIPGIDDGVKSIEESVDVIRELHDLGYKKLITTPHIMSDCYKNTPEIIKSGLADVKKAVAEAGIPIEVEAAAEYYLDYEISEKIGKEQFLTFGKNNMLFELSFYSAPESFEQLIFDLQISKYNLILAHPERYHYWHDDLSKLKKLKDNGVMFQLNLLSMVGHYSEAVRKAALVLIKNNMIDYIGTDCHGIHRIDTVRKALKHPDVANLVNSGCIRNKFI